MKEYKAVDMPSVEPPGSPGLPSWALTTLRQRDIRASFERSDEGIRARRNRLACWVIAGSVFVAGSITTLFGWLLFRWAIGSIAASIGATIVVAVSIAVLGSVIYRSALTAFTPQAAIDAGNRLAEEEDKLARDTTLPALLRYNRDQMALYHQIATSQARVAGRNSQTAIAIGFLALVAGSIVAIVSNDAATKLITGGLAALGGIFSGYIARTFFVAQDKAIGQLYKYWEQPLTTSYILMAERVTNAFADNRIREKELGKLIDQLLSIAIRREVSSIESRNARPIARSRSNRAKDNQNKSREEASQSSEP